MTANDGFFEAVFQGDSVQSPEPEEYASRSREGSERSERRAKHRLESVYAELYPSLLRFLRAKTRSVDEAKDVAQETFGKLLELDGLDNVKSLPGFIWKTAQNLLIDRQRQRANRSRLDPVALFEPVQQFRSPEFWLDAKQRLDRLERAIDQLPPTCRSVFVLRVLKDLSPSEVAHELGISERLVRQYVARSIEHCAGFLDDAETADGIQPP